MIIPRKIFLTKGIGIHKDKLLSFEIALRDAGIEKCNLVYVSSIFPPHCKIIPKAEGLKILKPGQITFSVFAKNETNEPNKLISAAIGVALPTEINQCGYLSEHCAFGEEAKNTGLYAEHLAATMLATALGVKIETEQDWKKQKQTYKISGKISKTTHICQSAISDKNGNWTTVIAAAILLE